MGNSLRDTNLKITGLILCFIGSFLLYIASSNTAWIVVKLMSFYIGEFYVYYHLATISWGFLVVGFIFQLLAEFRKR